MENTFNEKIEDLIPDKNHVIEVVKKEICAFSKHLRQLSPISHNEMNMITNMDKRVDLDCERKPNVYLSTFLIKTTTYISSIGVNINLKIFFGGILYCIFNHKNMIIKFVDCDSKEENENPNCHYILQHVKTPYTDEEMVELIKTNYHRKKKADLQKPAKRKAGEKTKENIKRKAKGKVVKKASPKKKIESKEKCN